MPSMDGDNKNMLDAMYADMDPFAISSKHPPDDDHERCETR